MPAPRYSFRLRRARDESDDIKHLICGDGEELRHVLRIQLSPFNSSIMFSVAPPSGRANVNVDVYPVRAREVSELIERAIARSGGRVATRAP
jgi:hypothetical protein